MGNSCSSEKSTATESASKPPAQTETSQNEPQSVSKEKPKVIVVFGATGVQGGSVIDAMKDDKRFLLKAATRNLQSDKAKKLAAEGIALVQVNMDEPESCKEALKGAYGAFLVTNYFESFSLDVELKQGKNVVDAAKQNGLKHLVFSGLKSAIEHIGKEGCHHFEGKKQIADYINEQGVPNTVVEYAMYYETFLTGMKPTLNENGEYVLNIPMLSAPLDLLLASDAGEITHQVFLHPDKYIGKWLPLSSDSQTLAEYAEILSKTFDKKFVAGTITPEQFAQLPFPSAGDLAVMFEFYISGKCVKDIALTRELHPTIPTFEQWINKNRETLKAEFP